MTDTESSVRAARLVDLLPACTSDCCAQGKRPCPCPQSCGIAEPSDHEPPRFLLYPAEWLAIGLLIAMAVMKYLGID